MSIDLNYRVNASGPRDAAIAAIGMAPAQWELAGGIPFTGPSGKLLNEALSSQKISRSKVYVTNVVSYFVPDNNLYTIPLSVLNSERERVFMELDKVQPNVLMVMGADTLDLLTATSLYEHKKPRSVNKKPRNIGTIGSKDGIIKWRGSIFELATPSGRRQKCVAMMHPASFLRGQLKWLPLYKYIDVPRAVTQSYSPDMKLTRRSAIVSPSFRQATEWLQEMNTKEWVSIDYEGREHISCLGSGSSPEEALCIPMSRVGSPSYWNLEQEAQIWKLWSQLLQNPSVKKIAQNAAYEWIKSWLYGIYPNPLGMDTMHLHHCLYPDWGGIDDEWTGGKRKIDNPGHGLALITSQYTDMPYYKDDGRHWRPELGEAIFWRYNAYDVMTTFESAMAMKEEAEALGLWQTYIENYIAPFEHTLRMEWDGVAQDMEAREAARVASKAEIASLQEELSARLGMHVIAKNIAKGSKPSSNTLNLSSSQQLRRYLESRRYTIPFNRKTKSHTVDKDALAKMVTKYKDPDIPLMLRLMREQDFLDKVINVKLDAENKFHTHYKIGGTNATRWSSTESILGCGSNIQNPPRTGPTRSFFLPD